MTGNLRNCTAIKTSWYMNRIRITQPRISVKNKNIQPQPKLTAFYKKIVYIKLGESNLTTDCILLSLYSHKYSAFKYILLNIFGIYKFVAICSANLPEISVYKIFGKKVSILHIVLLLNACQFCQKRLL